MTFVDEIIREEKRKFWEKRQTPQLSFLWGKDGYDQLCAYLEIFHPKGSLKKGFTYLGAKHSWNRRRNGLLLSVKQI